MIGWYMMDRLDMPDFGRKKFDFSVIFLYNVYTRLREKSLVNAHVAQLEEATGLSPVQVLGSNPIVGTIYGGLVNK